MPKLSVNLSDEAATVLRDYMAVHGVTITETVRRAVSVLNFVEEARSQRKKILIEMEDKSLHEVLFFQD